MNDFLESKGLTLRQIEIVNMMVKGLTNEEIAKELNVKKATIAVSSLYIYKRLFVSGRIELIIMLSVFFDKNELKKQYMITDIELIKRKDLEYLLFNKTQFQFKYEMKRGSNKQDYKLAHIVDGQILRILPERKLAKEIKSDKYKVDLNKLLFLKIDEKEYKIVK